MIEVVESPKRVENYESDEGINLEDHDVKDVKVKPSKSTTPKAVSCTKRKSKRRGKSKNILSYEKSKFTSARKLFGKEEESFIMDAKKVGNIGRYLNHSCFPNVMVQNVFVDTHDLRFPWIAFFTTTFVRAGRELCWDYRLQGGGGGGDHRGAEGGHPVREQPAAHCGQHVLGTLGISNVGPEDEGVNRVLFHAY